MSAAFLPPPEVAAAAALHVDDAGRLWSGDLLFDHEAPDPWTAWPENMSEADLPSLVSPPPAADPATVLRRVA